MGRNDYKVIIKTQTRLSHTVFSSPKWMAIVSIVFIALAILFRNYVVVQINDLEKFCEKNGGYVTFDQFSDPAPIELLDRLRQALYFEKRPRRLVWSVHIESNTLEDDELAILSLYPEIKSLEIISDSISDNSIRNISTLHNLNHLFLISAQITNRGISHLPSNLELSGFNIKSNKITGDALLHLSNFSSLKVIDIDSKLLCEFPQVETDKFRSLVEVSLWSPCLDYSSVENILAIPSIKRIDIQSSRLSSSALKELSFAHPGVYIQNDGNLYFNTPLLK